MPHVTIAVEGCGHGELDNIYQAIREAEQHNGQKIDLLLCCGDFQAVRNKADLECMACPVKYRSMNSFYKYYSGEKVAPVLTIFIGGNHEASNHLQELYYGGWVAPRIYFLGFSGVVNFRGIRIAGLSGIYKRHDYRKGYHERTPYNKGTIRSVYHVRELEVHKIAQMRRPIDIFLSHDWPQGIEQHGNVRQLLRKKRHFAEDVQRNDLGSPCNAAVLRRLRPPFWFSAHLHVKFAALMKHPPLRGAGAITSSSGGTGGAGKPPVPAAAAAEMPLPSSEQATPRSSVVQRLRAAGQRIPNATKFLSLDKCLPRRHFLQVLQIETAVAETPGAGDGGDGLCYDEEWLSIVQRTHHLLSGTMRGPSLPPMTEGPVIPLPPAAAARPNRPIPLNFRKHAPVHSPCPKTSRRRITMPKRIPNSQTDAFLQMLGLPHVVTIPSIDVGTAAADFSQHGSIDDSNEIDLSLSEDEEGEKAEAGDGNEIDLSEDEDEDAATGDGASKSTTADSNEIELSDVEDDDHDVAVEAEAGRAVAAMSTPVIGAEDSNKIQISEDEAEGEDKRLQIDAMSAKALKAFITAAGLSFHDCVEKKDFRVRAHEAAAKMAA